MTHPLFYSPDVGDVKAGAVVYLDAASSGHAIRSQRLSAADRVLVSDGAGTLAQGIIESADPQRTGIYLETVAVQPGPAMKINLVQALAKGDRDLMAVEMATEIGVDAVTPWQAQRSIVRVRPERAAKTQNKWQAKLRTAAQQARRARIPELRPLVQDSDIAQLHVPTAGEHVIVLHEDGQTSLQDAVAMLPDTAGLLHLVVGPEGGVSGDEVTAVAQAGGSIVQIGTNVMRASTAGPVAIALLNQLLNRW